MNHLVVAENLTDWQRLKALVLDSVSSPTTRRMYNLALDEFMAWVQRESPGGFNKATVNTWRVSLEARGLSSSSISMRLSAVRKLAVEAADNGLLHPELAAGIARVKGVRTIGVRVGNWLSLDQAQELLSAMFLPGRGYETARCWPFSLVVDYGDWRLQTSALHTSNNAMAGGAL